VAARLVQNCTANAEYWNGMNDYANDRSERGGINWLIGTQGDAKQAELVLPGHAQQKIQLQKELPTIGAGFF
jgi:hypothetical protein